MTNETCEEVGLVDIVLVLDSVGGRELVILLEVLGHTSPGAKRSV